MDVLSTTPGGGGGREGRLKGLKGSRICLSCSGCLHRAVHTERVLSQFWALGVQHENGVPRQALHAHSWFLLFSLAERSLVRTQFC